ncbi:cell division protein FtsQ/DivIB [Plastorhodobacter daqingensis]|uniref:Cell division protein FtsQ n=1 Tax=Plastorhodobacter daqingensis TaxID=1387281 RepID=A0ABW2UL98_9RHOB
MQPVGGLRRDPAPSRWAYRWNRLLLTPMFRKLLRVGVPSFILAFIVGLYLASAERRDALVAQYEALRLAIQERPEFMLTELAVTGASDPVVEEVRATLGLAFPVSSWALDLEDLRRRIEALDPVARAELRMRPNGTLDIRIAERVPVIVWRNAEGLALLDAEGVRAGVLDERAARADLPLIAGLGADEHVEEALALFAAAAPIMERVRGLVRMGERRWDLVLDRDQRVLLPETAPVAALERVIVLDQARDLLSRDVLVVDLRSALRPTLRLGPDAMTEFRRVRGLTNGG